MGCSCRRPVDKNDREGGGAHLLHPSLLPIIFFRDHQKEKKHLHTGGREEVREALKATPSPAPFLACASKRPLPATRLKVTTTVPAAVRRGAERVVVRGSDAAAADTTRAFPKSGPPPQSSRGAGEHGHVRQTTGRVSHYASPVRATDFSIDSVGAAEKNLFPSEKRSGSRGDVHHSRQCAPRLRYTLSFFFRFLYSNARGGVVSLYKPGQGLGSHRRAAGRGHYHALGMRSSSRGCSDSRGPGHFYSCSDDLQKAAQIERMIGGPPGLTSRRAAKPPVTAPQRCVKKGARGHVALLLR
ncbi:hypothetical protein MRX96_032652 [Rhipicephalus microplus]